MAQNICPKCGSTNVGTSTAHKLKKGATYAADFALGYLFGEAAVDVMSQTGGVSDNVKIEKEYECKSCGYIWKGAATGDQVPDHILQDQKNRLVTRYKSTASSKRNSTLLYGIATAACACYCFVNDFTSKGMEHNWLFGDMEVTHYNWLWLLLCIVGICTLIGAWSSYSEYSSINNTANELDQMSVAEFRTSKYRQYV